MNENTYSYKEPAAIEVLRRTGVDILEAALVAKSAIEIGRGQVKRAIEYLSAGDETLKTREREQ